MLPLAILTKNRPDHLDRCIRSWVERPPEDRPERLVIFDDASDEAAAQANRAVIDRLHAATRMPIAFVTRAGRARFADQISSLAQLPAALVRFALLEGFPHAGATTGANRNATLLEFAGARFLSVDDDTVSRFVTKDDLDLPPVSLGVGDPTEIWPFADASGLAAATREVPRALATWGQALDIAPEVTAAWVGIAGDLGFQYPAFLLWLRGRGRRALLSTAQDYERRLLSRQIYRAPRRLVVCPGTYFQTTAIALDATSVLPPFMPSYRGQDIVFAASLRRQRPGARIAYLPFAIGHQPDGRPPHSRDDLMIPAGRTTLAMSLQSCFAQVKVEGSGDAERLRALGQGLGYLAALPINEFHKRLRTVTVLGTRRTLAMIDRVLQTNAAALPVWQDDLRRYRDAIRNASERPDYSLPHELDSHPWGPSALKRFVAEYARMLEAWPAIVQAARSLRAQGVTPSSLS